MSQAVPDWFLAAAGLAVWASICVCSIVFALWWWGLPVVRYTPRRHVPWGGLHVLVIFATYIGLMVAMGVAAGFFLPAKMTQPPPVADEPDMNHLVVRLLEQADWRVLLVCGFTAVIVAPIVEELFFRVFLQGWLEARQKRLHRRVPMMKRLFPGATLPILITALLFAGMHFRAGSSSISVEFATLMLALDGLAKIITALFAVFLVKDMAGATAADLGWSRETFFHDVGLGLLAFAAVAAPIYGLMGGLGEVLPKTIAPDPFVLFPFALVLGILYHRTHRFATAVTLHMALNATSLAMALLAIAGAK